MATLNYRHFGNPGRRYTRARYSIVNKKDRKKHESVPSFCIVLRNYSNAREYKSSGRGARRLAAAY